MNDNSKNANQLEDWEPCEGGELRQVVWRVKTERRNREMVKTGGIVVILLLCVFGATLVWQQFGQPGQYNYGGISCKEVRQHLRALKQNKIQDQHLRKQLLTHVKECPHCGPFYEEMTEQGAVSQVASNHDNCDCGGCHEPAQREPYSQLPFAVGTTK